MSEWRCPRCNTLLGILEGDKISIKYKEMRVEVVGLCTAICRRCGEESWMESPHASYCECIECAHDKDMANEIPEERHGSSCRCERCSARRLGR